MDNDLIEFFGEDNKVMIQLTVEIDNPNFAAFADKNPFTVKLQETDLTEKLKVEGIEAVKRAIEHYKQDRFYRNKKDKIEMIKPYIIS